MSIRSVYQMTLNGAGVKQSTWCDSQCTSNSWWVACYLIYFSLSGEVTYFLHFCATDVKSLEMKMVLA